MQKAGGEILLGGVDLKPESEIAAGDRELSTPRSSRTSRAAHVIPLCGVPARCDATRIGLAYTGHRILVVDLSSYDRLH